MTAEGINGGIEDLTNEKLQEIYLFALDLGRRAGKILQDGIDLRTRGGNEQEMVEKVNAVDIVTQTDLGKLREVLITITQLLRCQKYALVAG
jgi:hypothetical protein